MYDYEFVINDFNRSRLFYMDRFDKKLNDDEVNKVIGEIFSKYENAKSVMLNRVYSVY